MPEAEAVEAAGAVEAAAVVEAAEAAAEGGPAVAVSPEAAVAVVPGQAEGTSPDQGEADHLPLPEVLIVPVWSVLAPGVPQISNEEMAVEFLPETRFHAIGLPGNAWLTARLNYRRGGSTVPTSIGPRPGPGLGKGLPIGRVPGLGKGSPIGRVPGLGKGSPIGRATGTSAIS
jgi:hypothetical protein